MTTSEAAIAFFAKFIFDELGIVYAPVNHYQLESRLQEAAKQFGFASVDELHAKSRVGMDLALKLLLLDLATNNETLFFRDPAVFQAIDDVVLKALGADTVRKRPFRVWSAACSTGQETYSLSMLLNGALGRVPGGSFEIVATDISERVLRQAEAGVYTQLQVQRGLPAALLVKHFQQVASGESVATFRVKDELRRGLSFRKLNLKDSFAGMGRFDLILCRNVMIYQSPEGKKDIVARLYDCLEPNGYLILGAAESLIGINSDFEMVRTEKATIYRRVERLKKVG